MKEFKQIVLALSLPLFTLSMVNSANAQLPPECSLSTTSIDCQIAIHGTNADQAQVWRQEQQQIDQKEAQRQWQIRENAVQGRIAKHRATPSYGAIAASTVNNGTAWAGGYKTKEEAVEYALQGITSEKGKIIATISNTCAAVADLLDSTNINTLIVATDHDADTAVKKAWYQCEAKYGTGKCGLGHNGKAMCSGYDYGVFSK